VAIEGRKPLVVTDHTYQRVQGVKAQLVEAKHGRMVTNEETVEALVSLWERMLEAVDHD
jgi:predicted transcriptional regulator